MEDILGVLSREEYLSFELRALYNKYGYKLYKMSKFEAYDLYARNKEFLSGENMITFTDNKGTLLALKPDVTLSIIKSMPEEIKGVQKVCYDENVYRQQKGESFKEILQLGLECVGEIDLYQTCEVLCLAIKSMELIKAPFVLELSHMGLILAAMEASGVVRNDYEQVLGIIKAKNKAAMNAFCAEKKIFAQGAKTMETFITSFGEPNAVLASFVPLNAKMADALDELSAICKIIKSVSAAAVRIDFSCLNDLSYYNGIVFQGFVEGVPHNILSGGRYDALAAKMGKNAGAIGFALSLNDLAYLPEEEEDEEETVLIYADEPPAEVLARAEELISQGEKVSVQKFLPPKANFAKVCRVKEEQQ